MTWIDDDGNVRQGQKVIPTTVIPPPVSEPPPPPPPTGKLSRLSDPEWLEQQATRDALIGAYKQGGADKTMEIIEKLEGLVGDTEFVTWALAFQWLAITLREDMKIRG